MLPSGVNWREHISSDPSICHGKPCLQDTRILVSVILDCLASEMTHEEIITEYQGATKEGILATLAYSSELAQDCVIAA